MLSPSARPDAQYKIKDGVQSQSSFPPSASMAAQNVNSGKESERESGIPSSALSEKLNPTRLLGLMERAKVPSPPTS